MSPSVAPELQTTTPRRGTGLGGTLFVLLGVGGLGGLWAGTQSFAHRLGYHENLGDFLYRLPPGIDTYVFVATWACALVAAALLFRRGTRRYAVPLTLLGVVLYAVRLGPIYNPFQLLHWSRAYNAVPELAEIVSGAVRLGVVSGAVLALGGLALVGSGGRRTASVSHGSARWGDGDTLRGDDGLMIGRRIEDGEVLRFNEEGHLLTLAPTRSGKGVSAVIPNLLDYPGSVFVIDVKPENAAVTARRRREMGQDVHLLDPFGVTGGWDAFNPLDLIDVSSADAIDDARMIADMMVAIDEGAENVHWNETARAFLAGLALHVKVNAAPEDRHLLHLRKLATLRRGTPRSPGAFEELLNNMLDSRAVGGLIARSAAVLLQKPFKERGSVISALHRHTEFLDSPHLRRALGHSTFDLGDLKRRRVSLFICLPSDRLSEYHRWVRLMVGCTLRALMRARGRPERRVLMLLDEFQNLGRLAPVERDISLAGGFGVQFWLFIQDLSRLRATYPHTWETFLTNSDVLQAFGASNDRTTSEYLSWLTGETTIFVESDNESRGVSRGKIHNTQHGTGQTVAEKGRRLMMPDEVRRLDRNLQLLFVRGCDPLLTKRLDYLRDPAFKGQFDPNPQYAEVAG